MSVLENIASARTQFSHNRSNLKRLIFMLCFSSSVNLGNTQTGGILPSIVHHLFNVTLPRPEKVRTVEELEARKNEFVVLDFIGLVQRHAGYSAEEYDVTTDDGYILKLHRMTGTPSNPNLDGRPVVFIQQFLFGSSDMYVMFGPNQSIAMDLADAGYDVWLGNLRGNKYSRAHVKYSPDDDIDFWKFSMDEYALIDTPLLIDFILQKTNQRNLTYVGASMGVVVGYIFLSGRPEYNEKINLMFSVGPAVLFSMPSPMRLVDYLMSILEVAEITGTYEILAQPILLQILARDFCSHGTINPCTLFYSGVSDIHNLAPNVFPEFLSYFYAGTSYFVLKHYRQLIFADRKLEQFNWCSGMTCALSAFNKSLEYDLTKITAPIAVFYGEKDVFVKLSDAEYLKTKLKNVIHSEEIPGFNHLDFAINKNAKTALYDKAIELMRKVL